MIKYYNTLEEYNSAAKSAFESQVSHIGADNEVRFNGVNVVVGARSAKTGSIVALDGLGAVHFIALNTFNSASFMGNWTVMGVVAVGVDHPNFRGKLIIVHKTNASKKWSEGYLFKLTGYTLDGAAHSGTLNVCDSSAWGTRNPYVISYAANDAEGLVNQLNTYFRAHAPFTDQDWVAEADAEGVITLSFRYVDYRQASNTGSNGFALTANFAPDIAATSNMLRKNGARSGEGAITNMDRALAYFRSDNSSTTYNPSSDVTSIKRGYPICLPGYLGESQYQSDHCALLREYYGEGEEGWKKFMAEGVAFVPSKYGVFDVDTYGDGETNTAKLNAMKLKLQDGSSIPMSPAAQYCKEVGYGHSLFRSGKWHLPSMENVCDIVSGIHYGTNSDRKSDPLNAGLLAIGGSAISNGSYVWSASRYGAYYAWSSIGYYGFASGNLFCYAYLAVPCVLLDIDNVDA